MVEGLELGTPDEPFFQRLWKLGHLAFLVAVWVLPILAYFHYSDLDLRPELGPPVIVLSVGVVLWFLPVLGTAAILRGLIHLFGESHFRLGLFLSVLWGVAVLLLIGSQALRVYRDLVR